MPRAIEKQVEILERKVMALGKLTDRVVSLESQIVHLRAEVHDEFSAIRNDMTTEFAAVRSEAAAFRVEMVAEFAAVRSEAAAFRTEVVAEFAATREAAKAGDEETRRYMRILHEDVIERIARLGENRAT